MDPTATNDKVRMEGFSADQNKVREVSALFLSMMVHATFASAALQSSRAKKHEPVIRTLVSVEVEVPKDAPAFAPDVQEPTPNPEPRATREARTQRAVQAIRPHEVIEPEPPPTKEDTPSRLTSATEEPVFDVSMEATVTAAPATPVGSRAAGLRGGLSGPRPGTAGGLRVSTQDRREPGGNGRVSLPAVIREVVAIYPPAAREAGIEGQVVMLVTVERDGRVSQARVLKGLGHGLDEAAVAALKRFEFRPGTSDSEPQSMEIRYTYTFVLD